MRNLQKKLKKVPKANLILIIGLFLLIFLIQPSYAASWAEPTEPPPGGNVAAPINTTSSAQTKIGNLTIGTSAENAIFSVWGQICLNGVCQSNWSGSFVHLFKAPNDWTNRGPSWQEDQGFVYVKAENDKQKAAIYGEGFVPTVASGYSAGVYGATSTSPSPSPQYGVYGEARANSSQSYGIFGTVDPVAAAAGAYAGYFYGGPVGIDTGNLNMVNGSSLCFFVDLDGNGRPEWDCRKSWPDMNLYWTATGNMTYLKDTSSNLGVGGTSKETAKFYVDTSSATQGSVTLGNPSELGATGLPELITCGDGVCNGSDNIIACPQDHCATGITNLQASGCKTGGTNTIRLSWQKPSSLGTIILRVKVIGFSSIVYPDAPLVDGTTYTEHQTLGTNAVVVHISPPGSGVATFSDSYDIDTTTPPWNTAIFYLYVAYPLYQWPGNLGVSPDYEGGENYSPVSPYISQVKGYVTASAPPCP